MTGANEEQENRGSREATGAAATRQQRPASARVRRESAWSRRLGGAQRRPGRGEWYSANEQQTREKHRRRTTTRAGSAPRKMRTTNAFTRTRPPPSRVLPPHWCLPMLATRPRRHSSRTAQNVEQAPKPRETKSKQANEGPEGRNAAWADRMLPRHQLAATASRHPICTAAPRHHAARQQPTLLAAARRPALVTPCAEGPPPRFS